MNRVVEIQPKPEWGPPVLYCLERFLTMVRLLWPTLVLSDYQKDVIAKYIADGEPVMDPGLKEIQDMVKASAEGYWKGCFSPPVHEVGEAMCFEHGLTGGPRLDDISGLPLPIAPIPEDGEPHIVYTSDTPM